MPKRRRSVGHLCAHGLARCSRKGCPLEAFSATNDAEKHGFLCCKTKLTHVAPAQNGVHFRSPTHLNSSGHPPGPANCFNFGWSVVARLVYPQELLWTVRGISSRPCTLCTTPSTPCGVRGRQVYASLNEEVEQDHMFTMQCARSAPQSAGCAAGLLAALRRCSTPVAAAEPSTRPVPLACALTGLAHAGGVRVPGQ